MTGLVWEILLAEAQAQCTKNRLKPWLPCSKNSKKKATSTSPTLRGSDRLELVDSQTRLKGHFTERPQKGEVVVG